jgi:hypothetical protein
VAKGSSLPVAFSAYIVLIVLAFGLNLIQPVVSFLDQFRYTLHFPELATALGWVTPAEPGRTISLFNHPGAILLYSSILAYLIYHRAGYYTALVRWVASSSGSHKVRSTPALASSLW